MPTSQRLTVLSGKVDVAEKRAEEAESANKIVGALEGLPLHPRTDPRSPRRAQHKQDILQKEQEISSLQHKLKLAEEQNEKYETQVAELKAAAADGDSHKTTGENLTRKVTMLEEELEQAEKDLKETHEKWARAGRTRGERVLMQEGGATGSGRWTSRPSTLSGSLRAPTRSAMPWRRSTRCVDRAGRAWSPIESRSSALGTPLRL